MAKHNTRKPAPAPQAAPAPAPAPAPANPLLATQHANAAAAIAARMAALNAPATPAPAPAPQALPVTGRGAVTAARWFGPAKRANANAVCLTKAQVYALPATATIVCNVNRNPKGGNSTLAFACYFGKQPVVGATTTWGAFCAAILANRLAGNASNAQTVAAGHLIWDLSRGFISLQQ